MFEHFKDDVRQLLKRAMLDAFRFGHAELEARHLLYELVGDEAAHTVAGRALTHLDVDRAAARAQLEEDLLRDGGQPAAPRAGLDERDAEALRSLGIDLDEVRARIEQQFGPDALSSVDDLADAAAGRGGGRGGPAGRGGRVGRRGSGFGSRVGFSDDVKKLMQSTLREALALDDRHIDSAHLLLALLHTGNGWPLDDMGVSYERARTAVVEVRARAA